MLSEIISKKRAPRDTSGPMSISTSGPYKCPYCPMHFGRGPSFDTYDELRDHYDTTHKQKYAEPLDKKSFDSEPPVTRHTHEIRDFELWYRVLKSKHPHYTFIRVHRSSWSNYTPQYLFSNSRTKVNEAMTLEEIKRKVIK